ncbi:SDR family oxidoreductase [Oceanobacillus polygoni]|uniref:NADP-dependent 3-hydroxy acid dehydrogenase YdfG n=1 Tax=Oceanobacillus polygoni TaxID=1235259 RepID=A0A9X0YVK6_9BACI|nr:SDR family oxidoreductase [Oceanobacillus polygoni]MBP2077969.1 NADP-dependent 3-hydroxy acid dehydrogenase YdfG [Oceanobacillus polygoni]
MLKLKDKTAVVTGASSGIGAAIAKQLAMEGANVVLAARRKDKLEEVVKEINSLGNGQALAITTDVSKQDHIDVMVNHAVETFGKIDIYVNNAGLVGDGIVRKENVKAWDQMIDVNIKGVLYGIHAVLPSMLERSTGHIVNISSVSGQEVTKSTTVYSATKYAVRAISMGLEKELARTGVRVTNISPGMVETERNIDRLPNERKPLQTEDIAKAVIYAVTQPDYVNVNEITVRPV